VPKTGLAIAAIASQHLHHRPINKIHTLQYSMDNRGSLTLILAN
jgi:hypothetical protein